MTEPGDYDDEPAQTDADVQLGNEETLMGPLGTDPLDTGYSPPERSQGVEAFGTTAAEMADGESLEDRLAAETPDVPEVDEGRAGRLVEVDEGARADDTAQLLATDVGIDGAGASAEEAAMHLDGADITDNAAE